MAEESGLVFEIKEQDGDRVLLSVPMVGFPPGFTLRPGERVTVVREKDGIVARPLVRVLRGGDVSLKADTLTAGNQTFALPQNSVREEGGKTAEVFIVDRGSAEGPEQVIAVRPARPL